MRRRKGVFYETKWQAAETDDLSHWLSLFRNHLHLQGEYGGAGVQAEAVFAGKLLKVGEKKNFSGP
ncbi:MAG TPA: hypothetical protein VGL97_15585 [Bryobacteraceae bacterium]|jgi:hypothetical protein